MSILNDSTPLRDPETDQFVNLLDMEMGKKEPENTCYLPEDGDLPLNHTEEMGPIGPWATGRVDWSPLGGLTGTRPAVDHYSITRYSTNEWRLRNKDVIDYANQTVVKSLKNENDCKNTINRTYAIADRTQHDNTNRLATRTRDTDNLKRTLERAIKAMMDEISAMEEQRIRLKYAFAVLMMPESIATECLDRRCARPDTELIRDIPEEELIKEVSLIAEIKKLYERTLNDIEDQQLANRTARQRLEYDWSNKKHAYEIETVNCGLKNDSTTILFKPGATRFPNDQSTEEYWEHFTKEGLDNNEKCRQESIRLRGTIDGILMNTARDLRSQADTVERAFSDRIACMEEVRARLENDLKECLAKLVETENVILQLQITIRNMDKPMKVVQTRLDNRNQRLHVENCRDRPHLGLIEEVSSIQDGVSALLASLKQAEDTKKELLKSRGQLEREIMFKRQTLLIDRERCQLLRAHFPSTTALSGYV